MVGAKVCPVSAPATTNGPSCPGAGGGERGKGVGEVCPLGLHLGLCLQ